MKKKQLNLTSGPILRTLSELALPIMASSFLSTAYNITDMAWIGMLGSKAVAGVGAVSYTHLDVYKRQFLTSSFPFSVKWMVLFFRFPTSFSR